MSWFTGASRPRRTARELYGAVVAQARRPELYADFGVPDTPEGRFELVALHLVLLLERLEAAGGTGRELGQLLSETFVTDMDDNMREMGVGDLAVPRKVKRAAAGLFERALKYREAIAAPEIDGRLADLLADLMRTDAAETMRAADLAAYVRSASAFLTAQPDADVLDGRVRFPHITI